jgi:hypothetical protein
MGHDLKKIEFPFQKEFFSALYHFAIISPEESLIKLKYLLPKDD